MVSYLAKRENSTLNDMGFWQQEALFDQVAFASSAVPVVIDSDDILAGPRAVLGKLCKAMDIDFQPQMLRWPKGPHKNDGAWARIGTNRFGKAPILAKNRYLSLK